MQVFQLRRRQLVLSTACASLGAGALQSAAAKPQLGELSDKLKTAHASLKSVAIAHRGETVLRYHHQPGLGDDTLHNVASITKSVVSLLYGVAAQRGKAVPPEVSLLDVFPEAKAWEIDPKLAEVEVKHVLSLSTGFDRLGATVDSDYQDFQKQFYGPHFLRHALTRKVLGTPGDKFYYANMDAHLAAMVLQRAVGQPLHAFAKETLFDPLGIRGWDWTRNAQGDVDGAATMRLRMADLIRLGELVRSGGLADGKRFATSAYLDEATKRQVATDIPARGPNPQLWGYGFLWWTATTAITHQRAFYAAGYGGQFIYVVPSLELTVAITTQQISRAEGAKSAALIRELVMPVFDRV